ncbi:hypothetical protein VULLAG_LOCUS3364 [Vulpes lagopus]
MASLSTRPRPRLESPERPNSAPRYGVGLPGFSSGLPPGTQRPLPRLVPLLLAAATSRDSSFNSILRDLMSVLELLTHPSQLCHKRSTENRRLEVLHANSFAGAALRLGT